MSVAELSRRTNIHRNVLERLRRNEVGKIDLDIINALCTVLRVDVGDILKYVPDDNLSQSDKQHLAQRHTYLQRKQQAWKRYTGKDD